MTIKRLETDAPMMQPWEIEMALFERKMSQMLPAGMSMAILTSTPTPLQGPAGALVEGAQMLGCKLLNTHIGAMTAWTQMFLGMIIDQLRRYQPEGWDAYATKLEGVLRLLTKASGSDISLDKKPVFDPAVGA